MWVFAQIKKNTSDVIRKNTFKKTKLSQTINLQTCKGIFIGKIMKIELGVRTW
jgi:hypothetical protein